MNNLAIRIQSGGKRQRWVDTMLYMLGNDPRIKVIVNNKGLWDSAKETLTSYSQEHSHVLLLQDDVLVCRDFLAAVEKIIGLLPNEIITFFSNRDLILYAKSLGIHWVKLKKLLMTQAYCMPVARIETLVPWIDKHIKPEAYFDDNMLSMGMYHHDLQAWATAPSLAQHQGWNSTTLRGYKPEHVFEARLRMASDFIGYEESALNIDWTKGLDNPVKDNQQIIGDFSHLFIA